MMDYDRTLGSKAFDWLNRLLMVAIIFITLYPFYFITIVSLSNGNAVLRGDVRFWPVQPTLESYKLVFENKAVPVSLGNSVQYTVIGTIINMIMTILCAYPLARPKFSGNTFFTWVVSLTMFFSGGMIPLYLLVLNLGLINSMWALVLPPAINVWNMFIMRTAFQSVPEELYEAAVLDGANDLQTLWEIILPLSKPVLATLVMFYAVGQWNEFFNALMYIDDRMKYPIQLVLRNVVILGRFEQTNELSGGSDFAAIEQTLRYATIMVSTLPILAVYPFVQRYFVKGVMIGAIKG